MLSHLDIEPNTPISRGIQVEGKSLVYRWSKSKPSVPNRNPWDSSIRCLCPSVCVYVCVCECAQRSVCVWGGSVIYTEQCSAISGCKINAELHMHVLRFPSLAMGHSLPRFNHFIMVMEIGFNFPFLLAEWWIILTLAVRGKMTATNSTPAAPHPVHKHRSYLWRQLCCVIKNHHSVYIIMFC